MRNFILKTDYDTQNGVIVPKGSVVTVAPMSAYNDMDSLCAEEGVPYVKARLLLCEYMEIIYSPKGGFSDDLHDVVYIDHINFTKLPDYFDKNNIEVETDE